MRVYRIQPQGSELHGIETEASDGSLAGGIHVFGSLPEVYGCIEWLKQPRVELLTIECEPRDLKPNGDYEGETLKTGRGEVVERQLFDDTRAVAEWVRKQCSR